LASDTIRNWTIVSREKVAEITLHVPIEKDLRAVVDLLRETVAGERNAEVAVTALNGDATIVVRAGADDAVAAEQLESDLRVRVHERLRAAGVFA
jgi:small-conductance mechanosensitive channel